MISVEEAKRIMMARVERTPSEFMLSHLVNGHYLADDVFSPSAYPLFDMSAVDGYAVRGEGPWTEVGSIAAGEVLDRTLGPGECARIFTGARVPETTDRVLMQEHCSAHDTGVKIIGELPAMGANIRRMSESVRKDELLLQHGTRLDAAAIGLISSVGVANVEVHAKPLVSIIRTGSEFIGEGEDTGGRIHSSNEWMLIAALHAEGCFPENDPLIASDNMDDLKQALTDACAEGDLLITTGGASVGDHDLIKPALEGLGATIHFHGVAQKPGKPMLFATLNGKPVFALPGNPRAVLMLFYMYVVPYMRAMQGATDPWLRSHLLPLLHEVNVKGERAEFRAAVVKDGHVMMLADEGSHMLRSLVGAEALAYLPAGKRAWSVGDRVQVYFLPV